MESKPRILYLQKILLERTDEENMLSTTQLINILNDEYGISAHRTTITKDIAALQEFGMDIVVIHSTQSKYFVASHKFELPELKLLIDAVESSKFITSKKSDALIEKIHTMTSAGQVAKLRRNNYVVNRIKPDNEQIYYIIDTINEAINSGKQISFQYYDYTGLKKKVLKNKGEVYKLSPYKLIWCGDYYYVLGYSEKQRKVINFREEMLETDIENELVKNVTSLLMELGTGFAFMGQQYHLEVGGKDFYIDLLFYNTKLRCYVAIDLKTGEFKPEQAGKMNFYLSALDDLVKAPEDNPSVGLILCRDENRTIAEYALRDMSKPIGVSEYHLCTDLPLNLKNALPAVEDIRSRIDMKK